MPTKKEHKDKAAHDEFFVSTLGNPFFDWQVTGTFYAALQYVEAYLATQSVHSPTHPIRDSHIQRNAVLKSVYVDYRELETESRTARYDAAASFSQTDVQRLQRNLEAIKQAVTPHI